MDHQNQNREYQAPPVQTLPLGDTEFIQLMSCFETLFPLTFAVALSGGCDSLCLWMKAYSFAQKNGGRAIAFIVDHNLRLDSSVEIERLSRWLEARQMPYEILLWSGSKPSSRIQETARLVRYRLLVQACHRHNITYLLTGHHQDDQLETVLMRSWKGSGLHGLAGISAWVEQEGIQILRPFLSIPKARLRATLQYEGIPWIEDPSNQNPDFTRTSARKVCANLSYRHRESMVQQVRVFGMQRIQNEKQANDFLENGFWFDNVWGYGSLDISMLETLSMEVKIVCLQRIISFCCGVWKHIKRYKIQSLLESESFMQKTLGGCLLKKKRGKIWVYREPGAVNNTLCAPSSVFALWDHRFLMTLHKPLCPNFFFKKIGQSGLSHLRSKGALPSCAHKEPYAAWASLPAVWNKAGIVETAVQPSDRRWFKELTFCSGVQRTLHRFHMLPLVGHVG